MTSTVDSFECDYLRPHTPTVKHVFPSEQAELDHLNEQIRSLDSHMAQLKTLRHTLLFRSRQLHNLLSPISALPTEVLSCVFQQVIDIDSRDSNHSKFDEYRACLHQSFVLSSVSDLFRQAALCTSDLWKRVPLRITSGDAIGKSSALLQYCMALTANINVFVIDELDDEDEEEEASAAIMEILLTLDTTCKITAFGLCVSIYTSDLWIDKLKGCSFLMLDTLSIRWCSAMNNHRDIDVIMTATQPNTYGLHPNHPSSVRYLDADGILEQTFVSLLYQCPKLVDCLATFDIRFDDSNAHFHQPLTLSHLKSLTLDAFDAFTIPSSVQNLQLPLLESLRLGGCSATDFNGLTLLCRNVSSTLTTLSIYLTGAIFERHDLHQLRNLPLPNLKQLGFGSQHWEPLLKLWSDERGDTKLRCLPSITALALSCGSKIPDNFIALLDEQLAAASSYFPVQVKCYDQDPQNWSLELREELRSIVGDRQMEVTQRDSRILLLLKR